MKFDQKDRKILYQLDLNSRQSLSQIGKKVGLHKNSVDYRIRILERLNIIRGYYTVIDSFKLGYEVLKFYVNYQYTNQEIEKEIIEYFVKSKYTWAVYSTDGWFDLDIILWIKDRYNFYNFWENVLEKYGDYFQNQILSFYIRLNTYRTSYLLSEENNLEHKEINIVTGGDNKVSIDDVDFGILKLIAPNARIPLTNIAKKLNVSLSLVKYRFKKLIEKGVVQGFRINFDISMLGYNFFKVDIYFREYNKRKKIIEYIQTNPFLVGIDETVGLSHLELEFHLKNVSQLHIIMQDIINKFPNSIRNYKQIKIENVYKVIYFPEH